MMGRASVNPPILVDINWGAKNLPKVTLVGKGVCFDSGGLDLKPPSGMEAMKKDMGGAAHVLGLAQMIMRAKLPINLRVIIPIIENLVSGSSCKPGDIVKTRKGITVEITNTDAEGRMILCDALAYACESNPEMLIDFATLTGAARVAVGTEISALFGNDDKIVEDVINCANREQDAMWHMPLFTPYKELMESKIADLQNASNSGYGGAITAALFLEEFIDAKTKWLHFDIMGSNVKTKPGRPQGGEAMGIRGVFNYLQRKFSA
jgi:leucyl aminopeptidase